MGRRFQFSLRALLILMLTSVCFVGGSAVQRYFDKPLIVKHRDKWGVNSQRHMFWTETIVLQDGTEFQRQWVESLDQVGPR
jgi:hypothetical protein